VTANKESFLSTSLNVCILLVALPLSPQSFRGFSMKHCPACNFSFPDSHFVCDFDGAELVRESESLALIRLPTRRSFARRFMRSPKTLTALAILGLFVAAAFVGYRQTTLRSSRALPAVNVATPPLKIPTKESKGEILNRSASDPKVSVVTRVPPRTRRSAQVPASLSKTHPQLRNEHPSRQSEVARRPERSPAEKQPKFVAVLKTTWRVLKRPFSF